MIFSWAQGSLHHTFPISSPLAVFGAGAERSQYSVQDFLSAGPPVVSQQSDSQNWRLAGCNARLKRLRRRRPSSIVDEILDNTSSPPFDILVSRLSLNQVHCCVELDLGLTDL